MNEIATIQKIIKNVKSKLDAHYEFKQEYNKQLAFDFNLFDFFNVGENKISEILVYFLNEGESHGQGNVFLKEFINQFLDKEIVISNPKIICEKVIFKKRRIDIYIEFENFIIAIENKVWADDQNNQLKDYANYLDEKSNGNFLLLYLNPYGQEPSPKSINDGLKEKLTINNQYKTISYKYDILRLIDKWITICQADNVLYFIREFKKYLIVKFIGNNTLNMSKKLREIIYGNQTAVQSLVSEYKSIEHEIIQKLNEVGKELDKKSFDINLNLEIGKSGLFNYRGARVYKYSISKDENKIWIQLVQKEINLYSSYYIQEGTNADFKEIVEKSNINSSKMIDYKQPRNELINLFLEQFEIGIGIFKEYMDDKEELI